MGCCSHSMEYVIQKALLYVLYSQTTPCHFFQWLSQEWGWLIAEYNPDRKHLWRARDCVCLGGHNWGVSAWALVGSVGMQQKPPSVSSGWLCGSSFQPQSSSSCCQPAPLALLHMPGAGMGTSRARLWGFVGHLGLRFAGMRRKLSSQVSVAWEQVNRNARLIILKCCGHQNGALAGGNWKMCHLLFDFLMSLLQFTEYKG